MLKTREIMAIVLGLVFFSAMANAGCKTGKGGLKTCEERFSSGRTREIASLLNDKLHGIQRVYFENGTLRSETTYRAGVKEGEEKRFFESGLPMQLVEWRNGARKREVNYYVNGKPKLEERLEGVLTRRIEFHENGKPSFEVSYQTGTLYDGTEAMYEGTVRHYNDDGKVRSEAIYEAGKRNGVSRTYHGNGRLAEKRVYDRGRLVSRTEFDLKEKVILSEEYAEDGTRK